MRIEVGPVLLLTPFYFIVIIVLQLAMNVGGVITASVCPQLSPITLFSTPADIQQCYGGMDIASYVRGAYALQEHGLEAFGSLGYATWPPGFFLVELLLIKLEVVPLPLALFLLGSMLWAAVFYCFHTLLRQVSNLAFLPSVFVPLTLLIIPPISNFYLWDSILMSEQIATPLFAIAILSLWRHVSAEANLSLGKSMIIGLTLGGSVLIRAQFDLAIHAMVVLTALVLTICAKYPTLGSRDKSYYKSLSVSLLVAFATFLVIIVPYKSYMAYKGHGFVMANVAYIFESVWKPEAWHVKRGAGFFTNGGGHMVCVSNQEKCDEFERRGSLGEKITIKEYVSAALKTVLLNPVQFISLKAGYFWKAWLELGGSRTYPMFNIILSLAIFVAALGRVSFDRKQGLFEGLYFLAIASGLTVFSFIVHFEYRYLYPVKLFGVMWVILFITGAMVRIGSFKKNSRV